MAEPTIVIVGAGPAGTRAAQSLVAAGIRPIVVDEAEQAGGQIYRRPPPALARPYASLYGFEAGSAEAVHKAFDDIAQRVDYRPRTLAHAIFDRRIHLNADSRLSEIAFDVLILATGATDRLLPVPGWTLPGVFSLGGAQIALKAQATTIGARPVLMGTGPLMPLVAYQYAKAGTPPTAVLDVSPFRARVGALPWLASRPTVLAKGLLYSALLARLGVPVLTGITPLAIHGVSRVEGVAARTAQGREVVISCDAVGLGFGLRSETQLADLAGARFAFDAGRREWLPAVDGCGRTSERGVYIAGDGGGILGADAAELSGRLAGLAALRDLGRDVATVEMTELQRKLTRMRRFKVGLDRAFPWPAHLAARCNDDTVLCRCEAITAGEVRRAVRTWDAREVNRAKSFARVGMGRCQGRYCGSATAEVLHAELGVPIQAVGRLRGQAPVKPVAIASERTP